MNKAMKPKHNLSRGMILPTLLIVMLIVTTITLSIAGLALSQLNRTSLGVSISNALLTAEAGAEQSLHELNQNNTFSGFASEVEFFNNNIQGRGTYTTTIVPGSLGNEKIITSVGRTYSPANASSPTSERAVRLVVVGTTTEDYSVQTGPGGLIMGNSATISNGDVRVNGYLQMSNTSRIGSESNPGKVFVAHINCPATGGSTYPTQCTSGQPITMNNSAHIYGEVYATNQTNGDKMSNPGLIANSTAEGVSLPGYDRQAQIDAVTTTQTNTQASCTTNNGTVTWPANLHITGGKVEISHSCEVIIQGNVWVDGYIALTNSSKITVASSLTQRPAIMIDGQGGFDIGNSAGIITNDNEIGIEVITFHSAASCSPDCSDVTGTDLYNSRNINTINLNNTSLGAGSKFYARWSKLTLRNSGSIGAILGQTIALENTGNISFGTNLSSGDTVWSIKNYQQVFEY